MSVLVLISALLGLWPASIAFSCKTQALTFTKHLFSHLADTKHINIYLGACWRPAGEYKFYVPSLFSCVTDSIRSSGKYLALLKAQTSPASGCNFGSVLIGAGQVVYGSLLLLKTIMMRIVGVIQNSNVKAHKNKQEKKRKVLKCSV